MENIFKYLDDTQYDSIYDRPFNELDLLILTELAYLSFDGLVTRDLELDKSKRATRHCRKLPSRAIYDAYPQSS